LLQRQQGDGVAADRHAAAAGDSGGGGGRLLLLLLMRLRRHRKVRVCTCVLVRGCAQGCAVGRIQDVRTV
jgi:hypothetical protein